LHFVGTSIFFLLCVWEPALFHSIVPAGLLAMAVKNVTVSLEHGLVEMAAMMGLFLYHMHRRSKAHIAVGTLLTAYGFAWVGHFFFEHNRPATFIYPIYSLMGDLRMWTELAPKYLRAFGSMVEL
jgi:hypothetical protein